VNETNYSSFGLEDDHVSMYRQGKLWTTDIEELASDQAVPEPERRRIHFPPMGIVAGTVKSLKEDLWMKPEAPTERRKVLDGPQATPEIQIKGPVLETVELLSAEPYGVAPVWTKGLTVLLGAAGTFKSIIATCIARRAGAAWIPHGEPIPRCRLPTPDALCLEWALAQIRENGGYAVLDSLKEMVALDSNAMEGGVSRALFRMLTSLAISSARRGIGVMAPVNVSLSQTKDPRTGKSKLESFAEELGGHETAMMWLTGEMTRSKQRNVREVALKYTNRAYGYRPTLDGVVQWDLDDVAQYLVWAGYGQATRGELERVADQAQDDQQEEFHKMDEFE